MIPETPSPCPTLRQGLALGAPQHQGFVNAWNWIVNIFRNIKRFLPTSINGCTGDIAIVAGQDIDVVVTGNTITIGAGKGKTTQQEPAKPKNGGGGGDEEASADDTGGGAGDDSWQEITPAQTSGFDFSPSGSGGMFKWDKDTRTIGAGGCMVGRKFYTASGTGSGKADNLYSVRVTFSSGNINVAVVSDASLEQAPTNTQCWIPIYEIVDGEIATDYRGAFSIPAFD